MEKVSDNERGKKLAIDFFQKFPHLDVLQWPHNNFLNLFGTLLTALEEENDNALIQSTIKSLQYLFQSKDILAMFLQNSVGWNISLFSFWTEKFLSFKGPPKSITEIVGFEFTRYELGNPRYDYWIHWIPFCTNTFPIFFQNSIYSSSKQDSQMGSSLIAGKFMEKLLKTCQDGSSFVRATSLQAFQVQTASSDLQFNFKH